MLLASSAQAQVCNVKVVTDANPDYSDIGSMLHSITDNWQTPQEKCWAIWYWNHRARRQTQPMHLHGMELTDPIRQFNDYGFTMCSTVAGVNCGIWGAMGYKVKFWDISLHTVPEVEYDGLYHMYDSSLSAIYTLCDGKTIAGIPDIGDTRACAASEGKAEPGHIAKYHCLASTSPNGYLTGCDTPRSVAEEFRCFNPNGLKFRWYFNNWDLGHRYILNLRPGEVYTRYYARLDKDGPNESKGEKWDPAYTVRFGVDEDHPDGQDAEAANWRYHIRGNGIRTFTPELTANGLAAAVHSQTGVRAKNPSGVEPTRAGEPGEIVFKIEGANVITSMTVKADFSRRSDADVNAVAVSTNNGLAWRDVWKNDKTGDVSASVKLLEEVNGSYEVLVKVTLMGKADTIDAQLRNISFDTVTQVNSKTQPMLRLGRNTVCVGTGEQTESTVIWPDIEDPQYKEYVVEEKNVLVSKKHTGYQGSVFSQNGGEESSIVFKVDTPRDMTRLTYGGRLYNRGKDAHIDFLHSFDGGKSWTKDYSLTDTTSPWDVIHYAKIEEVPAGTKSALVKCQFRADGAGTAVCSIYAVRIEANYRPASPGFKPMEVTFTWSERQKDYSLVQRSHTELVGQVPHTYTINVGGEDHPVVNSLRVGLKGPNPQPGAAGPHYGYSDGKDVGGEKFQERWVTYGKVLSTGKPYTCTVPSGSNWGAGDPQGTKLTDGIVGPPFTGGTAYATGPIWSKGQEPVVTVDLGRPEKCGVFRIHTLGYPFWDAIKGEVKDKAEVLTSLDDKEYTSQGFFDFNLRWKDLPANYMWNDDETFCGYNFQMILDKPVSARYVRYKITPARTMGVSEVQVLDSITYAPFDLKIALPDGKDRSDITKYLPVHTPAKPYQPKKQAQDQ